MKEERKKNSLFTDAGHINDSGVLLYCDGLKLNKRKELPESLLTHVSECSTCREEIFEYYEFVKEDEVVVPHPFFDKQAQTISINWRFIAVAAAVALVMLSAVLLYNKQERNPVISDVNPIDKDSQTQEQPTKNDRIATVDTTAKKEEDTVINKLQKKAEVQQKLIAYVNIPSLDEQIARAATSRGISVLKPVVDQEFSNEVLFQWEPAVGDTLELSIFTAENISSPEIIKIAPNLDNYKVKLKLTAGLHYWKIRQLNGRRKKQIGLGRFRIVR